MIELSIHKKLWSPIGEMPLHVNVAIEKGCFVTLYGKSGAGKTSTLRIIAGLLEADKGRIVVNGETWLDTDQGIVLTPQKRKAGFLFQDYALFPNMTVKENLEFALGKSEDGRIIAELIEIMELGELKGRKPETLSGGQKQRVALARSLVQRPEVLLLDEPLSALDMEMRLKLQPYILQVHRDYGLTTILISHDTSEILKMSDLMMVIDEGQIIKQGTPAEVFTHKEVSGKFQFVGEVISMERQDFIFIVSVLIGNELVKVIANESDVESLEPGDKVLVASKAFNPIIKKITP
jgi:molybdate transport system ATP-binding protein